MMAAVFIEPHERHEALEAYQDRLSPAQRDEIEQAPEGAIIRLSFGIGAVGTVVTVIEEG